MNEPAQRGGFQAEMDQAVQQWELSAIIAPCYPEGRTARPPIGLGRKLDPGVQYR